MTKMTVEIPDTEYQAIKISAIKAGLTIKDYILEAVKLKRKVLIRDDGLIRVLKQNTVEAFEESRNNGDKLKSFSSVKALMKELQQEEKE